MNGLLSFIVSTLYMPVNLCNAMDTAQRGGINVSRWKIGVFQVLFEYFGINIAQKRLSTATGNAIPDYCDGQRIAMHVVSVSIDLCGSIAIDHGAKS